MSSQTTTVPKVIFSANTQDLILPGKSIEESISAYRDLTNNYHYIESTLDERLSRAHVKRDELSKNLQVVRMLQSLSEPVIVDFELGDCLYAKAKVSADGVKVNLWLSQNTMLAYSLEEAEQMLAERVKEAEAVVGGLVEEERLLKEQITTSQVNMARLYNFHVQNQSK